MGVAAGGFHGQADAIVGDALIDLQFFRDGGLYPKSLIGAVGSYRPDDAERFDNSCKHGAQFREFLPDILIFTVLSYICNPECS